MSGSRLMEAGVKEVETARSNQETPVENLPPGTYYHVVIQGSMNAPLIQGSSNVSDVSNVTTSNEVEKLKQFFELVSKEYQEYNLGSTQKAEVNADILTANSQLESPKPKLTYLKTIGQELWITIRPFASEVVKQLGVSLFDAS